MGNSHQIPTFEKMAESNPIRLSSLNGLRFMTNHRSATIAPWAGVRSPLMAGFTRELEVGIRATLPGFLENDDWKRVCSSVARDSFWNAGQDSRRWRGTGQN
jgi:hypothetical protein